MPAKAQETAPLEKEDPAVEALLKDALDLASQSQWDQAFALLDEAEALSPDSPKVASYRKSINELQAVDTAQESWETGKSTEVQRDSPEVEPDRKFVIERDKNDVRANPDKFRDMFRGQITAKFIANNPDTKEWQEPWSSLEEVGYSAIGADLRFWMPFLGRSLGLNVSSSGYSWKPGKPESVSNSLDFGINLRGFLAEKQQSRLEIGLDLGISRRTTTVLQYNISHPNTELYLGLWITDSLFFNLFKIKKLENLVLGGKLRIYAPLETNTRETVHYGIDIVWRFKNFYTGINFDLWDFYDSSAHRNQPAFSVILGTHFR